MQDGDERMDRGRAGEAAGRRGAAQPRQAERHWAEWMAAAQRGDADAYRKLLEEILPVVRRRVHAQLFDQTLAEDVVQNVMLNVHRARHTYRPERPFGPWLRAITRNAIVDALRERGRRGLHEASGLDLETLPQAAIHPEPEGSDGRIAPDLRAALDALPPRQREAVELVQLQGLSVVEAATRVGVTPGALKVRAHRGYRALRERLGGRTR